VNGFQLSVFSSRRTPNARRQTQDRCAILCDPALDTATSIGKLHKYVLHSELAGAEHDRSHLYSVSNRTATGLTLSSNGPRF
jgi:hypothetical protein